MVSLDACNGMARVKYGGVACPSCRPACDSGNRDKSSLSVKTFGLDGRDVYRHSFLAKASRVDVPWFFSGVLAKANDVLMPVGLADDSVESIERNNKYVLE